MTNADKPVIHRAERSITFMIASVIGLSIVCMIVGFVAQLAHLALPTAIYNFVIILPLIGLPIGVLLIVALVILFAVRRSREARNDG